MKLKKALNNNVALVVNENGEESVIMGSGVAYNLKPGASVDASCIEKHFVLNGEDDQKAFDRLLNRISVEDIELASEIIQEGEKQLGYHCNDSILLSLSDHIGLMMERARNKVYFGTPLEWDIKLIYPKEYQYAKMAVTFLKRRTHFEIPDQEAAFIALHFINANSMDSDMHETMMCTKIIQNILNIIRLYYGKEFKEDNFDVNRFITHVRYFVRRQINGDDLKMDIGLARVIAEKCPEDYRCAMKILRFLNQTYGWNVSEGEVLYLTLHLNRINLN